MSDYSARSRVNWQVSGREWSVALAVAVAMTLLLIAPYWLGHRLAPPDTLYTGLLINVEDGTYLSAIEQGRTGSWVYRNLFTAENHEPAFIQGFYLALGHLARLFGLSGVAMWHVALATTNLILFLTTFAFITFFLSATPHRFVAYLLALLGSGFDLWPFPLWFERASASALDAVPVTLRMPEAHLFFSALTYPHFNAGIILIVAVLGFAFLALRLPEGDGRRLLFALFAGLANLGLAVVYPYLIFLTAAVLSCFYLSLLWQEQRVLWPEAAMMFLIFLIPVPLFLYYQSVLVANPIMQAWNTQAVTLSPNPLHYALTYAPYLALGLPGLKIIGVLESSRRQKLLFLWIWLGAVALLLYAPINPQRRFVEGVQIPLAILATVGLFEVVLPRLARTRFVTALAQRPRYSIEGIQRLMIVILITFTSLVSFYLLAGAFITLSVIQPYPFFRPRAEVDAMRWLHEHITPDDVVLASYWTGSYLPYQAGSRVVVGHRYETVHFDTKRQSVEHYFNLATHDAWRQALLEEQQVTYIFVGHAERELGDFDPAGVNYLETVFQNEQAAVYRVMANDK